MRVFLSHASADHPVAQYLRTVLTQVGVDAFLLPDDAPPGTAWMEQIRAGLQTCDEVLSIVTPDAVLRPWLSAEWACFWMQDKPCTPLLVGVGIDQLWEPMRAYQAADALDPSRLAPLLRRYAAVTGRQPPAGVVPLATEARDEIDAIRARQRLHYIEAVLSRIARNLPSGTDNVRLEDVAQVVRAERVTDLVDLALTPSASDVKRKQVALGFVAAGRLGESLVVARAIDNRNEAANVAKAVVRAMDPTALAQSEEWQFLIGIHEHLRDPQRRTIADQLAQHGIVGRGPWGVGADPTDSRSRG